MRRANHQINAPFSFLLRLRLLFARAGQDKIFRFQHGVFPLAGTSANAQASSSQLIDLAGQYSTAEVADLVGLKPTQVRHYVRRDLLNPLRGARGEFRFSFQDMVMLRSAKELLDAQVPVRRTNRVLLELKARNAQVSRPLSSLRVQAQGTRVVVQDGNASWDAESGQGSLPFMTAAGETLEEAPSQAKVAMIGSVMPDAPNAAGQLENDASQSLSRKLTEPSVNGSEDDLLSGGATEAGSEFESGGEPIIAVPEAGELSSDDWYNLALDLEEAEPEKAPQAYLRALEINPNNTDAQVNLGRLCQLRGNLKQARRHYKLALEITPEHQLANYNMGTIYDELDEFDTAREYYVRACDIPDAHYNLARLFEVRGDELAALRHMREYRRLLEADISGR